MLDVSREDPSTDSERIDAVATEDLDACTPEIWPIEVGGSSGGDGRRFSGSWDWTCRGCE